MNGCAINARPQRQSRAETMLTLMAFVLVASLRLSAASDSLTLPDRFLGRLADSSSGACAALGKQQARQVQHENMADLLRRATLWLPLRNGGFGQYDAVSILGANPGQVAVSLDGRPMNDIWSGQVQLTQIPVGSLEQTEFLYGTDAIGLSTMAASTLINAQSVIYNSSKPYMSMWYHQGAGDLVAANVVFAQNIAKGLNVSVNVRRAGARGRYQRTDFDQWNLDLQSRWTIDSCQSLLVRYGLATLNTQVWGGVDAQGAVSTFEETTPVSLLGDRALQDESRRHDMTATYRRLLNDDSTSVLSAQAYVSGQSMHRNLGSDLVRVTEDTSRVGTIGGVRSGIVLKLDESLGALRMRAGSHVAVRAVDSSSLTSAATTVEPEVFLHTVYAVSPSILLRSALRVHSVADRARLSYGLGASLLSESTSVKADLSVFYQSPSSLQNRYAVLPERHTLAVVEATSSLGDFSTQVVAYYRQIADAVELYSVGQSGAARFVNTGNRTIAGLLIRADTRIAGLDVTPRLRYQQMSSDTMTGSSSMTILDCAVSYEYRTVANSIRFGVMGSWMPASTLASYNPLYWFFQQGAGLNPSQFDGASAFMTARVGNASLRLSYENILGNRWQTVQNAPELTRVFRLSVDWSFTD